MVGDDGSAWWIYSLTRREAPRRLAEAQGANTNAVWTPDGTRIAFRTGASSVPGIFSRRADGVGSENRLLAIDGAPVSWSRDGKTLFYISDGQLWSWTRGAEPQALAAIDSRYASLSPDRRWVAFHAREHGKAVPYIQSLSHPGERYQISATGGHAPLWSPDGRRLFYVAGETNSLMAVDVQTTPAVVFGEPMVLMPEIAHGLALSERWYDVSPDGKRLIVPVRDRRDPRSRQIEVVLNWTEELKHRAPAP
jgi:Tol biopolymer transport system component